MSSTTTSPPEPISQPRSSLLIISAVCAVLLGMHIVLRFYYGSMKEGLDAIALGLAIVGLSPWIASIIKTFKLGGVEVSFQEVRARVEQQGADIRQLQFLISNFVPRWELEHLRNLADEKAFIVNLDTASPPFEAELRHLRGVGFIRHKKYGGIGEFMHGEPRTKNLHDYFELTDTGREFLRYWEASNKPAHASSVEDSWSVRRWVLGVETERWREGGPRGPNEATPSTMQLNPRPDPHNC
jgi:hypothetical protein